MIEGALVGMVFALLWFRFRDRVDSDQRFSVLHREINHLHNQLHAIRQELKRR